jgi:hypothetical protein
MAQATKMGADSATLEARRRQASGFSCSKCGAEISQGDLMLVKVIDMQSNGRASSQKVAYHRKCYGLL